MIETTDDEFIDRGVDININNKNNKIPDDILY